MVGELYMVANADTEKYTILYNQGQIKHNQQTITSLGFVLKNPSTRTNYWNCALQSHENKIKPLVVKSISMEIWWKRIRTVYKHTLHGPLLPLVHQVLLWRLMESFRYQDISTQNLGASARRLRSGYRWIL